MRVDELRRGLEDIAGPPRQATSGGVIEVRRAARRQRALRVGLVATAVAAALVVGAALALHDSSAAPHVTPADPLPTTTIPPPPPPLDAKAFFDQPRLPVSDE